MSASISSIPASQIVSVTPGVLAAGGSSLNLNGLFLTTNSRIPIGQVLSFPSHAAVVNYLGLATGTPSATYFSGYDGSTIKPGALLLYQYNTASVGAYLRGGSMAGVTLAQLQALTGVLTVTIDGTPHTSSAINLGTANSFSAAAELITQALGTTGPAGAAFTGAVATTVLTVSAVSSGALSVGQEVRGSGVTAGTLIVSLGTGTGGTGTYNVSVSQTVGSEAMTTDTPAVTYDSVSNAFLVQSGTTGAGSTIGYGSGTIAASLMLTQATGAVLSQGAVAQTPAGAMNAIIALTQNWATFTTLFDPDGGSGDANKLLFSAWANGQNNRYVYVGWDTDAAPAASNAATSSFGYMVTKTNAYSGTIPVWDATQGAVIAAFIMGTVASINFAQTNGRITLAFRKQSGLAAGVTNQTAAVNLAANGYNFYGRYATANDNFTFLQQGTISGPFTWGDTFVNEIWMNSEFQLAVMLLLQAAGSIPYNTAGYAQLESALLDPINAAGNFGVWRAGVTLSAAQVSEVNTLAGTAIAGVLQTRGWYLQILDASPTVRQARGSPPCTFFYTDGESIQALSLASIAVQ